MPVVAAYDDVVVNQKRSEGDPDGGRVGGSYSTKFFNSKTMPDYPHAGIVEYDPGRKSSAHFHINDQFQIVVSGKGRLGRHDVSPYCVHFSRAYTPYGPLAADPTVGMGFIALRAHYDERAYRMPKERDELNHVSDRRPWQITRQASFPPISANAGALLQAIPGIEDNEGLAAYTLSMTPNATTVAPSPAHGDGQYLFVTKGTVLYEGKEHRALALIFVYPKDGPLTVHAGADGLQGFVLNFPRRDVRAMIGKDVLAAPGFETWRCSLCSFVYNEGQGLPQEGIAPGTRWRDVPETWNCPDCSAAKSDFHNPSS